MGGTVAQQKHVAFSMRTTPLIIEFENLFLFNNFSISLQTDGTTAVLPRGSAVVY